ncbi:CPBP family intramembrane metalloprotease [Paenibacillus antri]|uniref:CPBP family intramembrane metalloprotease n=1 Tax=Paenibacillus antri TaxID=2582848 RepID=A0A5R9G624_9BACL|nr:type II CAAX endopeptidase family protein [Paenibacillus antri]TLS50499.1 CPBP family intramembrane metalloprotease [Paenibacillus antri]
MQMRILLDRRWWLIAMAAAVLVLQWCYPTAAMTIWPPFAIVAAAIAMFWSELRTYDWGALKRGAFWEAVFYAVTQGMIAQAAGIVVVQYGFGVASPALPFALTPGVVISAVVFSGILEELVYRKSLFGLIDRKIGFWPAACVSSVLFALAHANVSAYLGYFLLGLVWCRAYRRMGNIGIVIAAHMAFNVIAMFVMAGRG